VARREKFDPTPRATILQPTPLVIRQGDHRRCGREEPARIGLPIHITETLNKFQESQRELSQELGPHPEA